MYAGKALVHLNDLIGGQKQFNMEYDFIEKLSDLKEPVPKTTAENAISIMTYNSMVTEYLIGTNDVKDKLVKLRNKIKI